MMDDPRTVLAYYVVSDEKCDATLQWLEDNPDAGVAVLPDGTLWALEWRAHEGEDGEIADPTRLTVSDMGTGKVANPYWSTLYRLVPLSAEAGDTDA
jgi:hypothetical protein